MKDNAQKTVVLLWGIPGSGKTHYAEELQYEACPYGKRKNSQVWVIDCDRLKYYINNPLERLAYYVVARIPFQDTIVVDGLITTNQSAKNIMDAILAQQAQIVGNKYEISFEIVWWERDVVSCLYNDSGRRTTEAKITIENAPFEEPNQEIIAMAKKVTKKQVVRKPAWKAWAQKVRLGSEEYMKSSGWCLGGTAGSCWSNEKTTVSASAQPASFVEFDDLLSEICPNISFLQYKKIYNHCVSTDESTEHDYYGGSCSYGCYTCNVPELYKMLCEMGIVQE
jgi:hypothetical protein